MSSENEVLFNAVRVGLKGVDEMTNLQMAQYIQGFEGMQDEMNRIEISLVSLAADLLKIEGRLNFRGLCEVVGVERAKRYWADYTGADGVKINER